MRRLPFLFASVMLLAQAPAGSLALVDRHGPADPQIPARPQIPADRQSPADPQIPAPPQASAGSPVPADPRLRWFHAEKFGMMIHWGPYSQLAGQWDQCRVPPGQEAEWIMNTCRIPVAAYREMAHRLNPERFDSQEWVRLARAAGMRYLVFTAKHHDGFAMYRSAVSRYNIADWTSFGRDPLEELAESCRREGLPLGVYYSHREDWDDPDGWGNDWDRPRTGQDFERYLERKSKPQLRELLTRYGPLALVWFDRGMDTEEHAREFVQMVRDLQPSCLVSGRVGSYDQELLGDYQSLSDNGMAAGRLDEAWETPQTLNQTWGYSRFDQQWKTPLEVVRRLVDVVSKGGNYLLNVGPRGDGSIPAETVDTLKSVGNWLGRNGASIYETSACPLAATPWGRCTSKDNRLYLHVFDWPSDGMLRVHGIRNAVHSAALLAMPGQDLRFEQRGSALVVQLPRNAPDRFDSVVLVTLKGSAETEPPVNEADRTGAFRLDFRTVLTTGKTARRYVREGGFHISSWSGPEDSASWFIKTVAPGRYALWVTYAALSQWEGAEYTVTAGPQRLRVAVQPTAGPYRYQRFPVGMLEFSSPGTVKLSLRPAGSLHHPLMRLHSLELVPRT